MCFTPAVSLTTAIIEFLVGTLILIKYKNYLVPVFSALFIYVLGIYQFTEFMLCKSSNPFLWAKLGIMTYTFLPAILLHFCVRLIKLTKNKTHILLFYLPPIIFAGIILFTKGFILEATCEWVFVTVQSLLFYSKGIIKPIYLFYYFGYIFFTIGLLTSAYQKERNKVDRKIILIWDSIDIIALALSIIFVGIFHLLFLKFPSVYCEFALLFTIAAWWSSEFYSRKRKKEKFF